MDTHSQPLDYQYIIKESRVLYEDFKKISC